MPTQFIFTFLKKKKYNGYSRPPEDMEPYVKLYVFKNIQKQGFENLAPYNCQMRYIWSDMRKQMKPWHLKTN